MDAHRAPREASAALRSRGWRWSAARRAWSIEVDERRREEEVAWAQIRVYAATDAPSVSRIDWTTRHSAS